jgi:hypothetical protein
MVNAVVVNRYLASEEAGHLTGFVIVKAGADTRT